MIDRAAWQFAFDFISHAPWDDRPVHEIILDYFVKKLLPDKIRKEALLMAVAWQSMRSRSSEKKISKAMLLISTPDIISRGILPVKMLWTVCSTGSPVDLAYATIAPPAIQSWVCTMSFPRFWP